MATLRKRGNRWFIDYYVDGRRLRKSVGKDKRLAEIALKEIEVKLAKKELLNIQEKPLVDYIQEYLDYSKANKSYRAYQRDQGILAHFLSFNTTTYLHEMTPHLIEKYKKSRLDSVKPTTVNRELNTIKNLFAKAVEWGYLKSNPAKFVKKFKEKEKKHPRFLSQDEIKRILEVTTGYMKYIILILLYTGMRRDELIHLEWSDIDLERGFIRVEGKGGWHPKSYKPRTIPINGKLREIFAGMEPKGRLVFDNGEGEFIVNPTSLSRSFRQIAKKAGVTGVNLHTLRHTFASHLVMRGESLRTVQVLLGHQSIVTTQIYSHLAPDHLRSAIEKLDF